MNGIQAIQSALETTKGYVAWYVGDFSDADLLVRPVPTANHAAWQIGNIIGGDIFLVQTEIPDAKFPELPAGFTKQHGKDGATDDDASHFMSKAEYLKLFGAVRSDTIAALRKLSEADLDRPCSDKMKSFAPTFGKLFQACSDHTIMHLGQVTCIRRKLGKPVLF
ncbi:MAG: DinB family protein [Tepidisphaeraceae bacterium]